MKSCKISNEWVKYGFKDIGDGNPDTSHGFLVDGHGIQATGNGILVDGFGIQDIGNISDYWTENLGYWNNPAYQQNL